MMEMDIEILDLVRSVSKLSDADYEKFKDIANKSKFAQHTCECKCTRGATASAVVQTVTK